MNSRIALAAAAALRPNLKSGVRPFADALAVGTGVFLLAAVLQAKGWRYHFVPALSLASRMIPSCAATEARVSVMRGASTMR